MLAKIIQEKLKPGMAVNFILVTGREITGKVHKLDDVRVIIQDAQTHNKHIVIDIKSIAAWEILTTKEQDNTLFEDLNNLPDTNSSQVDNLKYETVVETEEFEWKRKMATQPQKKSAPIRKVEVPPKKGLSFAEVPWYAYVIAFLLIFIVVLLIWK